MGVIAQYAAIAVLLAGAVFRLWRHLAPSKTKGCDSGCGSCASGCKPARMIALTILDMPSDQPAQNREG